MQFPATRIHELKKIRSADLLLIGFFVMLRKEKSMRLWHPKDQDLFNRHNLFYIQEEVVLFPLLLFLSNSDGSEQQQGDKTEDFRES